MHLAAVNKNIDKGSTVFYVPLNNDRKTIDGYRQGESVGFGIFQIVLGIVCVVLNGVSSGILHYHGIGFTFLGVWSGALYIATGILGILAVNTKVKCQTVTYMLLCLLSSSFVVAVMSTGIRGATCGHRYCLSSSLEHVIEACILVSAIIEGILGILGAVLCFKAGICCGKKRSEPESLQIDELFAQRRSFDVAYFASTQQLQVPHSSTEITSYNQQGAFDVGQRLPLNPPPYSASVENY